MGIAHSCGRREFRTLLIVPIKYWKLERLEREREAWGLSRGDDSRTIVETSVGFSARCRSRISAFVAETCPKNSVSKGQRVEEPHIQDLYLVRQVRPSLSLFESSRVESSRVESRGPLRKRCALFLYLSRKTGRVLYLE